MDSNKRINLNNYIPNKIKKHRLNDKSTNKSGVKRSTSATNNDKSIKTSDNHNIASSTRRNSTTSLLRFYNAASKTIDLINNQLKIKIDASLKTKTVTNYFENLLSIYQNSSSQPISLDKDDENIIYILNDQRLDITNVCRDGEMNEKIKNQSSYENKYTFEGVDLVQIIQALNKLTNAQSSTNASLTLGIQQSLQANNLILNNLNTLQNLTSDITKFTFQNLR